MPREMERALKAEAAKRGYGPERTDRFVYGSMRSQANWKPEREKKSKKKGGKK